MHARTPEGWRLRPRSAHRMVEPSVALRSSRSLEGLLLGTPPSPDGEARRRRRSAPSKEADERRNVPRRRRGCTRGAWSEDYQTKARVARSRPKRSEEAPPAAWDDACAEEADGEAILTALLCGVAKTLGREGMRSGAAPLSEFCTECTAVIPLSCVECCNITIFSREYTKMLAVRG